MGNMRMSIVKATADAVPLNSSETSHHNSFLRLKMAAAGKLVRIRQFIERGTKMKYSKVMWSDSESVINMVYDRTTRFPVYYANRPLEIHAASNASEWRYVDTKEHVVASKKGGKNVSVHRLSPDSRNYNVRLRLCGKTNTENNGLRACFPSL